MIDLIILGSIRRGNEYALEQLIDKYSAYVCVVIRNAVGNSLTHEDVEETASDVFLAMWENADRVQKVKSWLGATARNKAKNKLREIRDEYPLEDETIADGGLLEDEIIMNSERDAVKRAILAMNTPDREIFVRYYYGQATTHRIGDEIGMSESAVQQRLVRGREKLKLVLGKEVLGE